MLFILCIFHVFNLDFTPHLHTVISALNEKQSQADITESGQVNREQSSCDR